MSKTENAKVAYSYVSTQLQKAWFMANAQRVVVLMSGVMLFVGVILLYTNIKLTFTKDCFLAVFSALPVAIVAAPLAIIVEGMNIVASRNLGDVYDKICQEKHVLTKNKKSYTKEEFEERKRKIEEQFIYPIIIVSIFSFFSLCGAEIFWHKLTENSSTFFQIIGYIIGMVTSIALIYLEINQQLIERGIKQSISSSALIYKAIEMDIKSQILHDFSKQSSLQLQSSEVIEAIKKASHRNLFGPLSEICSNMGTTVEAEQLKRIVEGKIAEREAADFLLSQVSSGDTEDLPVVIQNTRKPYHTEAQRKCKDGMLQYGKKTIEQNIEEYAELIGVSPTTLRTYMKKN